MTAGWHLLDLCCSWGGAGWGYHLAGFSSITGVDNEPQPGYPFNFIQADALTFPLDGYDAVHASPLCWKWSAYRRRPKLTGKDYPDMIGPIRDRLKAWGGPYIIENVPGAPLVSPVTYCGSSFGLDIRRHRLLEAGGGGLMLTAPPCDHAWQTPRFPCATNRVNLRRTVEIGVYRIPIAVQQKAMGIDWMPLGKLSQAIPPAYTEHAGRQLLAYLNRNKAASQEKAA
jgi:DNA (cytosine-5)-methyltransferase 1